jgi:sugar phosphate permease
VAGLWFVGYTLGFVLLSRELESGGLGTYGLIMASYGAGNLGSALIFGNVERKHSEGWLYFGILLIGFAFICIGLSHSLFWICFFSALCATGGPLNDTPMLELIQANYPIKDQIKVLRLRWVFENFFMLVASLISPLVFHLIGTRQTLIASGVGTLIIASLALLHLRRDQKKS